MYELCALLGTKKTRKVVANRKPSAKIGAKVVAGPGNGVITAGKDARGWYEITFENGYVGRASRDAFGVVA